MRQTTTSACDNKTSKWYLIDATDKNLGRIATKAATILRGKHKPDFSPHQNCGDFVIIINAQKVNLTGNKLENKIYYNHSRYPGGMRERTAQTMVDKYPVEMVERAVHGMIPHTPLGDKQRKKLFVYADEKHNHEAQQPEVIKMDKE